MDRISKHLSENTASGGNIQACLEALSGALSLNRQELGLRLGHILQRIRGQGFLGAFAKEIDDLRSKGRIADDYLATEQAQASLQLILNFLDDDAPDEIRFDFVRRAFLAAATESTADRESVVPQEFVKLATRLSSGSVLLFGATYRIAKTQYQPKMDAAMWLDHMAKESGLEYSGLVEIYELELIDLGLLTDRTHADRSGIELGAFFRLTNLGMTLSKFVESYSR